MASTGKCPHCGGTLRSDEKNCPNCGAANEHYISDSPRTIYHPKTIEELKEYCAERGMPLLRMRFFIGEDYKEPRAFGIYRDGEDVVVYKNKADGSRAIRYKGPDEAHGVNELFQKLLSECHNRGIYPDGKPVSRSSGSLTFREGASLSREHKGCVALLIFYLLILTLAIVVGCSNRAAHANDGYYQRPGSDKVYYQYGDSWYYSYENGDGYWHYSYTNPSSDIHDYSLGDKWSSSWDVSDFRQSDTWDDLQDSSSSSDYDSWDSGGTDWSSDW